MCRHEVGPAVAGTRPSRWVSAVTTKLPRIVADCGLARLSTAITRSRPRGSRTGSVPDAGEPAQLRLHPERTLKDHAVGGALAVQRAERPRLALGEQPGRQVRARVTDLGERPQRGRDPAAPRRHSRHRGRAPR